MAQILEPIRSRCASAWQRRFVEARPWRELADLAMFRGKSIALVGNAGYLASLAQGSRIDRHDVVIRMNNFRVTGFEEQLGSRTDVLLTNFYTDVDFSNRDFQGVSKFISSSPNNFRKMRDRGIHLRHGPCITTALRRLRQRVVYVPSLSWFETQIGLIGRYPSTGACGIFLILQHLLPVCGTVSITGFSFFQCRSHYFSHDDVDPNTNHDAASEQALIRQRLLPHLRSGRVAVDAHMGQLLQGALRVSTAA